MLAESDIYSFTYKNHPLARTFHSNIETQRQNRNIQCISRNEERQNCKTTSTCHKYYTSKNVTNETIICAFASNVTCANMWMQQLVCYEKTLF